MNQHTLISLYIAKTGSYWFWEHIVPDYSRFRIRSLVAMDNNDDRNWHTLNLKMVALILKF